MWILLNQVTYLVNKFNDLASAALEKLTDWLQRLVIRHREQAHRQLEEDPNCFSSLLFWTNLTYRTYSIPGFLDRKPGIEYVCECCLKANQQVRWAPCFSLTKASTIQLLAKKKKSDNQIAVYTIYTWSIALWSAAWRQHKVWLQHEVNVRSMFRSFLDVIHVPLGYSPTPPSLLWAISS